VVQGAMQPAAMQRAISQYLAARTLAPLANADFGAAQAVGGGEASARNRLRLPESGEQQSVRRLQEAIWTPLDLNTIVQMQGLREHASGQTGPASLTAAETEQTFPGRNGRADPDVVVDLVRRHLTDIRAAYPSAFRDSGLTTPGAVAQTLGE